MKLGRLSALFCVLVIFAGFSIPGPAGSQPNPTVNVLLEQSSSATVECGGPCSVASQTFPAGSYSFFSENGTVHEAGAALGQTVQIVSNSPIEYISVDGRPYRGAVVLKGAGSQLSVINRIGLEEYLYGVVGAEMPGTDLEALKAQAVASRTLAVNSLLSGGTLRATVSQQVYAGVGGERAASNEAVDDTRGQVLYYGGQRVTSPLFFSTCGGKTEASQDVFGRAVPYLQSVDDAPSAGAPAYCSIAPHFQWQAEWPASALAQSLAQYGVTGQILNLTPSKVDENGRVEALLVQTTTGAWNIHGFALRHVLRRPDGGPLYSTWFSVQKETINGEVYFVAQGKGEGHGVGLCQWGAIGMARSGKSYQDILAHYYQGTRLADFQEDM